MKQRKVWENIITLYSGFNIMVLIWNSSRFGYYNMLYTLLALTTMII